MASFENDYLNPKRQQQRQIAEQDFASASQANKAATDEYLGDMSAVFQQVANNLNRSTDRQIKQLSQDYQYAYDKNAIQQLANERQVADRMSQMGLTDSGLNRTQQAAINLQRTNADQAVTQQKNAQVNALQSALMEQLAKNQQSRISTEAQARLNLANRNQDLYTSLMQNADSLAGSLASNQYSADQQLEAAKAQAAADAQAAQQSALLKQYELGLKYGNGGVNQELVASMAKTMYGDGDRGTSYGDAWNQAYNLVTGKPDYNRLFSEAKNILDGTSTSSKPQSLDPISIAGYGAERAKRLQAEKRVAELLQASINQGIITDEDASRILISLGLN